MRKLSMQSTSEAHSQLDDSYHESDNDVSLGQVPAAHQSTTSQGASTVMAKKSTSSIAVLAIVAIVAGVATGFGGSKLTASGGSTDSTSKDDSVVQRVAGDSVKKGDVFGSKDESTFKDTAEGYLEAGGLDGEGSHRLLRPGGDSQTVYLTSSVTDLDKLTGMEVKVWGETFKGQKAGWLMDVGRVEVVNPKGTAPAQEE